MGSQAGSGIAFVPTSTRNVTIRSLGRIITRASGELALSGPAETEISPVKSPPLYALASGDFGTRPVGAEKATFKAGGDVIKITDSVNDTLSERITESIPVGTGNTGALNFLNQSTFAHRHTGNRIVQGRSDSDQVVNRNENTRYS